MARALFFTTAFLLSACVEIPDPSEFMDMDCESLLQLGESYERTALLDQADLFNDGARDAERRASGSPWADNGEDAGEAERRERKTRNAIRAAYRQKGCQP